MLTLKQKIKQELAPLVSVCLWCTTYNSRSHSFPEFSTSCPVRHPLHLSTYLLPSATTAVKKTNVPHTRNSHESAYRFTYFSSTPIRCVRVLLYQVSSRLFKWTMKIITTRTPIENHWDTKQYCHHTATCCRYVDTLSGGEK